jgi:hypothetical protein
MKRTLASLLLTLSIAPIGVFSEPIFAPALGMEADVALHADTIWYANVQAPVMWTDLGFLGASLVPSFSANSSGFHGHLSVEGMIVLPPGNRTGSRILLHAGAGLGGYQHSGLSEIVPLATFGLSLLADHVHLKLNATSMVMTKYYANIDTFTSLTIGYCFPNERN